MSILGMYELTHPESLSDSELKEILENVSKQVIFIDNFRFD